MQRKTLLEIEWMHTSQLIKTYCQILYVEVGPSSQPRHVQMVHTLQVFDTVEQEEWSGLASQIPDIRDKTYSTV